MDHGIKVRLEPVEDDEMEHHGAVRNVAEEHDDPTGFSIGPLRSYEPSFTSLQISWSIPPTVAMFCWSTDVLSAFDHLPVLDSEEVESLNSFLSLPSSSQPVSVRNFLVAFQSRPDLYTHLRKLAQQLKSLGRTDIVKAMHREKAALQWLGYDWKWLAEHLSIPRHFIDLWQEQGGIPADNVLKTWQVKVNEATVGRLFDLLIEHREDLAALL
ncbi:uncharacterized protein LOC130290632 [Hyla sarda]|uniref:uncharacterized protein LOC130290632 n=1 Tax=Hyla sarda TaxID=327740 RepID=UPI0024C40E78|nr:uncharacterized protein LOC130290632 [Hyla sarda]